MNLRIAIFCGNLSPYGKACLVAILRSQFNIALIVLPTRKRSIWFYQTLLGVGYPSLQKSRWYSRIINVFSRLFHISEALDIWDRCKLRIRLWKMGLNHSALVMHADDVNDDRFHAKIAASDPDLIISAAYPQIFKRSLLGIPKRGCVNLHPSLLPRFRGAHPHFWAVAKGETVGGLTAHFLTEGIDDGDIIAQVDFPIGNCTYSEVYERMILETPRLVRGIEDFFRQGEAKARPQNPLEASVFRNDREIHRRIFWNIHTSDQIYNLCRTEQAFCFFRGCKIVCSQVNITASNRNLTNDIKVENGTIVDINEKSIVVKAIDGCVNISQFLIDSKRFDVNKLIKKFRMNVAEKLD